jgi:imidazolonepropionase-like amidohydrolase
VSSIVIKPGRLIDGCGQPALEGMLVVIDGNQIARVGKVTDGVPEAQTVIEAPQATLMPGMVDAHVHLAYDGSPKLGAFRLEATSMSYPLLALRAVQHGLATLHAGFTAVRDLNAPGGVILALRDAVNAGYLAGPRVKACGQGLSVTSGHMDKGGWADHISLRDMNFPCNGADSFRYGVREQVKRGADCIKINLCGGSSKDLTQPYKQEMTDEEVIAAIDEAHRLERHVAAHTSGGPSVTMAVRAGLDSVEHGHWIDDETADLMAEKGCTYVPTLLVNERNFDFTPEQMGVPLSGWTWLERARDDKWASLERVHRAGVKIAVGTDAGFMVTHGEMNARELEYLVQGGLSPLEAITAATKHGAELLGIDAGTIENGKLADLLLVDGRPDEDVRVLQDASKLRVFKAGKEVTA